MRRRCEDLHTAVTAYPDGADVVMSMWAFGMGGDAPFVELRELLDAPGEWSHEYFPRVSNDGALLAYGASQGGHEHDVADYEIFLWRIGTAPEAAARVSFHTGNDQWPDVWVEGAAGAGP